MAKRSKQTGKKPKPEILMFLVEGETDELTLGYPIEAFVSEYAPNLNVKFTRLSRDRDGNEVSGGDSTSDYSISPRNFDLEISKRVMKDLTRYEGVYPKYIVKVIQIIDTDGAYIDDSRIVPKHTKDIMWEEGVYYGDDEIEVDHVQSVVNRHCRKRKNLDYLCTKTTIKLGTKTVPYSIYYNSCNLEHFLYGEKNTPQNEKGNKARIFVNECIDHDDYFISQMSGEFSLKNLDYKQSWEYIRDRTTVNSLSRCSNLYQMLEDIKEWALERYSE